MGLIPSKAIERVQFYENHTTGWASNAVAIGTSTSAVTDLTTKTTAARDAYDAHQAAQDAAKNATQAWHQAVVAMSIAGAAIVEQIRAKAKVSGDSIYTLANIPAPNPPAPVGPPGMPFQPKVELKPNGSLLLKWKCNNPPGAQGTFYYVWRKVGDAGDYTFLGAAGTREFSDTTVPAGVASVTYQVQATRTTATGDAAYFLVNFGVGGGGAMTVASIEPTDGPKKIAA